MVSHTKRSHTLNAISKDVHCFYHNPAFHYTRVYTAGQHISVRELPKVINVLRINFETYGICLPPLRPKTQSSNLSFVFQVYGGMCGSRSDSDEQKLIC